MAVPVSLIGQRKTRADWSISTGTQGRPYDYTSIMQLFKWLIYHCRLVFAAESDSAMLGRGSKSPAVDSCGQKASARNQQRKVRNWYDAKICQCYTVYYHRDNNIMDHVMNILEQYATTLEQKIAERTMELVEERKKSDLLLYRMLPR